MTTVEVKLNKADRVYHQGDVIEGTVTVVTPTPLTHQGVRCSATGTVGLQVPPSAASLLGAIYAPSPSITLLNKSYEIASPGKIAATTSFPINVRLDDAAAGSSPFLYETYHGGYISIQYVLTVEVHRSMLHKRLASSLEFIVETLPPLAASPSQRPAVPRPPLIRFLITPESQPDPVPRTQLRPGGFRLRGTIASRCALSEPLQGEVVVENSDLPIKSIDVQVLRRESVAVGGGLHAESSEIQTTQVAAGDISCGLVLPIYVILPRLFTCPSVAASSFKIEFETAFLVTLGASRMSPSTSSSQGGKVSSSSKPLVLKEVLPLTLTR